MTIINCHNYSYLDKDYNITYGVVVAFGLFALREIVPVIILSAVASLYVHLGFHTITLNSSLAFSFFPRYSLKFAAVNFFGVQSSFCQSASLIGESP